MLETTRTRKRTYVRWSIGVLAALVLVGLAVQASGRSAPEPAVESPSKPIAEPESEPDVSGSPSEPSLAPIDVPSVPTAGPGVTAPGVRMVARPGPDVATVEVEETVFFPAEVDEVSLALLPADDSLEGVGAPTVLGLQAASEDGIVPMPKTTFKAGDGPQLVDFDGRKLTLRYTLANVVGRTPNSLPGRSLAAVQPLTANQLAGVDVVYYFYGDVTNIQCPDQPAARRMCGLQQRGRWSTVPVTAAHSRALVQFDQSLSPQGAAPSGNETDSEDAGATS